MAEKGLPPQGAEAIIRSMSKANEAIIRNGKRREQAKKAGKKKK